MASYPNSWLKIIHPEVVDRLGLIQHVLLDFDGTISVLRQGWEKVMVDLMLASICGESLHDSAIKDEVVDYLDQSTGILTIRQMEWLVEAVKRHGLVERPMSARQYKSRYLDMLMVYVRERIADVAEHRIAAENMMIKAIRDSGLRIADIDYISASANSVPMQDRLETEAIKTVVGRSAFNIPVSSIKSMIGEPFSAAGLLQIAASVDTIVNGFVPPTINYRIKDDDCNLDYVANRSRMARINNVLINIFGPGGSNASLVISKYH